MYEDLAKKIIGECLKVNEGETILINGPHFAFATIESFALECIKCGAKPLVMTWTDNILKEVILKCTPEESSRLHILGSQSESTLEGFGCILSGIDKLILFTSPIANKSFFQDKELKEKLAQFGVCLARNGWNLSHFKHHFLFLDHPSASMVKKTGLDYEECKKILRDAIDINYNEIKKLNDKFGKWLDEGNTVHITSDSGTDLKFSIKDRECVKANGVFSPEVFILQLPEGEVYIAPVEETAEGFASFNFGPYGMKFGIEFKKGRVNAISAPREERKIKNYFEVTGLEKERIGEFGIGTNPKAKSIPIGNLIEKVLGTCHIALGNNIEFGGKNKSDLHQDYLIDKPTIEIDGNIVMKKGRLVNDG